MSKKVVLIILLVSLILSLITASVLGFLYYKSKDKSEKPKEKYYYEVGEMISNLKNTSRKIKLNIKIEYANQKLTKKLESNKFIKHKILEIVRDKTETELNGKEGQINLQNELTKMFQELFNTDDILNVYFEEFIVS